MKAGRLWWQRASKPRCRLPRACYSALRRFWATLSTSGMRGIFLPEGKGRLTIATDGDDAGRAAGHQLACRADAAGWTVSTLPAPNGRDWNDILTMKGRTI